MLVFSLILTSSGPNIVKASPEAGTCESITLRGGSQSTSVMMTYQATV